MRFLIIFAVIILSGCTTSVPEKISFTPTSFSALPGWKNDSVSQVLPALRSSCARIMKKDPNQAVKPDVPVGQTYGAWQKSCAVVLAQDLKTNDAVRNFLEASFTPYEVRGGGKAEGLFTGYYEASLRGSRTRHGAYQTPLYTRPEDLIMVDLGEFREELKGQRIAGRVNDGKLKPYEDRTAIVNGQWPHNDKVLVWVDSAVDAFFVQIQGSGVVQMDDGSVLRIGYAGQNGHPYYAIGRELIQRGALTKDNVSMQTIRKWLSENPAQANDVMNTNKSYVFFEEKKQGGAIGAEGVVLTPERSLAVDRTQIPYGAALWVDIEPVANMSRLQRLMMAQDTGGAIRGAVRGDVFWGYGPRAEHVAGEMKSQGRYWILLPK